MIAWELAYRPLLYLSFQWCRIQFTLEKKGKKVIIKVVFRLVCVAMLIPCHFAKFVDMYSVLYILYMRSLLGITIVYLVELFCLYKNI